MITVSNLQWPEEMFDRADRVFGKREPTLVAFDVEWTKNFRIKQGNVPFCYSYVFIRIPEARTPIGPESINFGFKSVYVESADETQELIAAADADMERVLSFATYVTGHQFSSDLSVLLAAAKEVPASIQKAKCLWAARQHKDAIDPVPTPNFYDTRYDMGSQFQCTSRRLVDVCTDVKMNVHQPEIQGSMTAMHRKYLDRGDTEIRERISILNIRHSLSQALLACYGLGLLRWEGTLNVNTMINETMWDCFDYINTRTFQDTLS
jgi:hypothetical protein